MPKWRNGRRSGLKIRRPKGHEGSSPSFGTQRLRRFVPKEGALGARAPAGREPSGTSPPFGKRKAEPALRSEAGGGASALRPACWASRLFGWIRLEVDRPPEPLGRAEEAVHRSLGGFGERAFLATKGTLDEHGFAQEGDQVRVASRRPAAFGQVVSLGRGLEVDDDEAQGGWADDEVVQLGVSMRQPPAVKPRELTECAFHEPPEAGCPLEGELLRDPHGALLGLHPERREPRVGAARSEAAPKRLRRMTDWGSEADDLTGQGLILELLGGVAMQPRRRVRLTEMQWVGR